MSKQSADCIASKLNRRCLNAILAGDLWWPRTSGGRCVLQTQLRICCATDSAIL